MTPTNKLQEKANFQIPTGVFRNIFDRIRVQMGSVMMMVRASPMGINCRLTKVKPTRIPLKKPKIHICNLTRYHDSPHIPCNSTRNISEHVEGRRFLQHFMAKRTTPKDEDCRNPRVRRTSVSSMCQYWKRKWLAVKRKALSIARVIPRNIPEVGTSLSDRTMTGP